MPKPRKCRCGCGQPIPDGNTLRKAATIECALRMAAKATEKRKAKLLADEKKQTREARQNLKSLEMLCQEARKEVQRYARLRDGQWGTCICCGIPRIDDGAHYFPVGSKYRTSRLSLNPRQIHGACSKCNRFVGGGNISGYDIGLTVRYGPGILEEIAELKRKADHGEDAPLTKEEVRSIKKEFAAKCRVLIKLKDDQMMAL